MERPRHLLIVEDSAQLSATLAAALGSKVERVSRAGTLAEARRILRVDAPDVMLLDVSLPDGESDTLLPDLRQLRPLPRIIVVSGSASPGQAFRMAQAGVRAFVTKPVDLATLDEVWARTLEEPPDLELLVRAAVGQVPLRGLEQLVRDAAVDEALAHSDGSLHGAARLLNISRQLLQYIIKRQKR
jgi:DNA-binding NtrC family response regulator